MLIDQLKYKDLLQVVVLSNLIINNLLTSNQKSFLYNGRKLELRIGEVFIKGNANSEINTRAIAATPPNLFGILRKNSINP